MIENGELSERHVLPRWFSIAKARQSRMFSRPGMTGKSEAFEALGVENFRTAKVEFDRALSAWSKSSDFLEAEELLAIAFLSGRDDEESVHSAAMSVLGSESSVPAMKSLAACILDGSAAREILVSVHDTANARDAIRRRKHMLKLNPRDALLYAETALYHANLGQLAQSRTLLKTALALAPNSRYVLRSASRFLCHVEEPDAALRLIRGSQRSEVDPWLKAAELAIAGMIGEKVKNWRSSQKLAENESLAALDRSELAAEMATFEFAAGGRRAGLKKIILAASDPTENAAAQMEFLAEYTGDFVREEILPDISQTTEARALSCYWKGEMRSALDACEQWQQLEPFSIRPAIFGSFLSTARNNAVERGIALAMAGLSSNPRNSTLLNNLAVLYAYQNDLEKASQYAQLAAVETEDKSDIANMATMGLIHIRGGQLEDGIAEYQRAMDTAVKAKRVDLYLRAFAFMGRELCRLDPGFGRTFYDELKKAEISLKKRGIAMPREVLHMLSEFDFDSGSATEPNLLLQPIAEERIEDMLGPYSR